MSTDTPPLHHSVSILEFKSSTFSVPVLVLTSNDFSAIEQQLQDKIRLAPEFFKNSPLIIDLQNINQQQLIIEVPSLVNLLRRLGLLPIGIRHGNAQQNQQAQSLGIPLHNNQHVSPVDLPKPQPEIPVSVTQSEPEDISPVQFASTLITHPVRSGQRVYAKADLIILAQVSPGAEILAEGNIHVYGTLRGRALAGVQGNTEARIFCSDLQAELISIAGNYKLSDDLNSAHAHRPVQIYLQDHTLVIKPV